ncbi:MAG: HD domain-containing protein, partial [Chloroflexi bacterium]|nr:HD domain-containing protein [Chloroflexota bacterium]
MRSQTVARARMLWPAVLLASIVLLQLGLTFAAQDSPPGLGIRAIVLGDGSQELTWVLPTGYGWDQGLRPGDRIRYLPLPQDSDAFVALEVTSPNQGSRVELFRRTWEMGTAIALFALGLEFLAAGLLVYFRSSDRHTAYRFLFLSGMLSVALTTTPTTAATGQPWAIYSNWLSTKIATAAFAYFFCVVPVRRWILPMRLLFWALLPLTAWYSFGVLGESSVFTLLEPVSYAYMVLCLAVGVAALLWPFLTRAPKDHRRLWPVAVCSGIAAVVFLGGSLLPYIGFQTYLLRPEVGILAWALLPLGFVLAIFRYRVLGVDLGPWAVLRTVFETSADLIFVVGKDGRLVNASNSGLALLGIPKIKQATGTLGELLDRLVSPKVIVPAEEKPIIERVLSGQVVRDEEECLRLADGETAYLSVAGTPVYNEEGVVSLAVLVYRDITERKRAERALQRAHDELEERVEQRTQELSKTNRQLEYALAQRKQAEEGLKQSFEKLQKALQETIRAMALTVEMRDLYTAGHQQRVGRLVDAIAREMHLPPDQITTARLAALVHDIGKIRVPAEVLGKPGRISKIELDLLRTHSQIGFEILRTIEFPWPISQNVLQHHERMDGSGYPLGLRGEDILLEARILAVADVVEAMASHRPYRPALGIHMALDEITQNRGTLYDPQVVDACLCLFNNKG